MTVTARSILVPSSKGGRPRAAAPASSVSAWIPFEHHDRLIEIARRERRSVSSIVRAAVLERLRQFSN
jgi:hypothetical protein